MAFGIRIRNLNYGTDPRIRSCKKYQDLYYFVEDGKKFRKRSGIPDLGSPQSDVGV
jgi:hypothetical protein